MKVGVQTVDQSRAVAPRFQSIWRRDVIFTAAFVTIAHIPLAANVDNKASEALQELHDVSNRFHQHVNFPKRGNKTPDYDCVYSNIRREYSVPGSIPPGHAHTNSVAALITQPSLRLEKRNAWVCLLFQDFSSAFNAIIAQTPIGKLSTLERSISVGNWVLDFLPDRYQTLMIF